MSHDVESVCWGMVFAAGNIVLAVSIFHIALRQTNTTVFLRFVFGSMAGRMVMTLFAVWYALRVWHLAMIPFVLTLLTLYIAGLGVEIIVLHRKQLSISRAQYAAKLMKSDVLTDNAQG
ncbi:MAG: hypothetical protein JNN25_00655 [Candidatus Kapabacteria bacterium]|nr:hypothetical protein [Candidatus Kapabacteria bacterium]